MDAFGVDPLIVTVAYSADPDDICSQRGAVSELSVASGLDAVIIRC